MEIQSLREMLSMKDAELREAKEVILGNGRRGAERARVPSAECDVYPQCPPLSVSLQMLNVSRGAIHPYGVTKEREREVTEPFSRAHENTPPTMRSGFDIL